VSGVTRPAAASESAWIAPAALRSHVIDDARELSAILESEPWRVRVTERGEAALLDRWRTHTNDCVVLGLWCSPRRVPVLVTDLLEVARERGFDRLLGPLVPEEQARPYMEAGLRVIERVLVLRRDIGRGAAPSPRELPAGVAMREAGAEDMPLLTRLDAACFEPFWHYDLRLLTHLAASGRIVVAERDGMAIGYTLATVREGVATLGRLAVHPSERRREVGRALASEAVAWLASHGARRVGRRPKEENEASLALYRGLGFRVSPGALVACASGPL